MQITPIKTHKITEKDTDILKVLDQYLLCHSEPASLLGGRSEESKKDPSRAQAFGSEDLDGEPSRTAQARRDDKVFLQDKCVLAVSSKIVAICEGRIVQTTGVDKEALVRKEADWYLPPSSNPYGVTITIKHGMFIASAGIDESNGNGYYVLWPKDPQASANRIREHLVSRLHLNIGVIITDSRLSPLRWGVTGVAIAHSGFSYLHSYVGKPDIFGRPLHVEKVNVPDTLAAAAVGVMGEGQEQTPLALITGADFVEFQGRNPSEEELQKLQITPEQDVYAGLMQGAKWQKGGS